MKNDCFIIYSNHRGNGNVSGANHLLRATLKIMNQDHKMLIQCIKNIYVSCAPNWHLWWRFNYGFCCHTPWVPVFSFSRYIFKTDFFSFHRPTKKASAALPRLAWSVPAHHTYIVQASNVTLYWQIWVQTDNYELSKVCLIYVTDEITILVKEVCMQTL